MSSESLLHASKKDTLAGGEFLLPQLSVKLKDDIIVVKDGMSQNRWMAQWSRRRLVDPCNMILKRGLQPKLLSLSMALGFTIGLFPICGLSVLVSALAAVILQAKCHMPTLMLANIVVMPFQLMAPFMRIGELVTGADHLTLAPGGFWDAIRGCESCELMYGVMLHVIVGWCVFAPISVSLLYIGSLPVFQFLLARLRTNQTVEDEPPIVNGTSPPV